MNAATKKKLAANLVKARAALAAKRKRGWKPEPRKKARGASTTKITALRRALEQEAAALEERARKLRVAAELL